MYSDATQQNRGSDNRRPGEVDAHLLMAVSAVLGGTCLTVAAFLSSTPRSLIQPTLETPIQAASAIEAPADPIFTVEPVAPVATPVEDPCVGPSCAGAATATAFPTQPS